MGNKYYQQLLQADPTGFIDPFKDLGTYDSRLNKFKEPVSELLNPFSGRPYSKIWQKRIETMREIFISYIKSTADPEGSESRKKSVEEKESLNMIVSTYLKLGFHFSDIEKRIDYAQGHLRNHWSRKDHIKFEEPEFFLKEDLKDGYFNPTHHYRKE